MADPLSIAASALAVAGAGGKLAQTLYIVIESARKSEKHLKPVADHVKLTSTVLDSVGTLLEQKEVHQLCRDGLLGSTTSALDGCKTAFDDLRKFVDGLVKSDGSGKTKLGTLDRLTFFTFRQRELDALLANLERFKSSLDLVLSVLNLISSTRNHNGVSEIRQLKSKVNHLIKTSTDVGSTEAPGLRTSEGQYSTPKEGARELPTGMNATVASKSNRHTSARSLLLQEPRNIPSPALPTRPFMVVNASPLPALDRLGLNDHTQRSGQRALDEMEALSELSSSAVRPQRQERVNDRSEHGSDSEDELLEHLERCADAVVKLASKIEEATDRWRARRQYERHAITPAFRATQKAMRKLWAFEVDFDSLSDDAHSVGAINEGYSMSTGRQGARLYRTRSPGNFTVPVVDVYNDVAMHVCEREDDELYDSTIFHGRLRSRSRGRVSSRARDEADSYSTHEEAAQAGVVPLSEHVERRPGPRYSAVSYSYDDTSTSGTNEHRQPKTRSQEAAQGGLSAAATAGILERHRSKSRPRDRERSRSRLRAGAPIVAGGLSGTATADLYERYRLRMEARQVAMSEEALERRRMRRRSAAYDSKYYPAAEDPGDHPSWMGQSAFLSSAGPWVKNENEAQTPRESNEEWRYPRPLDPGVEEEKDAPSAGDDPHDTTSTSLTFGSTAYPQVSYGKVGGAGDASLAHYRPPAMSKGPPRSMPKRRMTFKQHQQLSGTAGPHARDGTPGGAKAAGVASESFDEMEIPFDDGGESVLCGPISGGPAETAAGRHSDFVDDHAKSTRASGKGTYEAVELNAVQRRDFPAVDELLRMWTTLDV